MNKTHYALLKDSPFFSSLPDDVLKKLAQAASLHQFKPGELIIKEGEPARGCYYFLSGTATVFSLNNEAGIKHLVTQAKQNTLMGEVSIISGEGALCSVEADNEVECLFIDRDTFIHLLSTVPTVSQKLLPVTVQRLRHLVDLSRLK